MVFYSAHNQTNKQHRNGIHKPKRHRYASLKGVRTMGGGVCVDSHC